ncbi:major capsid protein [Microviridae sp.]|nr:major capsid protein [Microviridae sp.]
MKSVMAHSFAQVPQVSIPRSTFNRDHGVKMPMDFDKLYPIFHDEMVPGDTAKLRVNAFGRLATPQFPIMDNMFIDTFFFAIPYRLVWENWQRFNGEQDNPDDSIDYLIPTQTSYPSTGYVYGELSDYFDIPPGVPDLEHSSLWHRAYNLVWNEWFRSESLQDSVPVPKGDGPDDPAQFALLKRGKRFDYFTSCLPFAQKDFGQPVLLPLGDQAPLAGIAGAQTDGAAIAIANSAGTNLGAINTSSSEKDLRSNVQSTIQSDVFYNNAGIQTNFDGQAAYADLTNATASTINDLRLAFQIQRMQERDARGGSRYIEIIKSHFGVTSPDFRLQRSEYLGGGSSRIGVNQVPSTVPTEIGNAPQGSLAAFGTVSIQGNGFTKSFTEHTLVIGLACARADITYQQGLDRMMSRSTRFDHYFPSFSHLGEQAILQKEIFASGVPAEDDLVFGYNERYAEMRYKKSSIRGIFRSSAPQSLDPWHLSQDFDNAPTLSSQFIEQNTPIERAIALTDEPHIILDAFFKYKHARPLPTYGTPGMIDHF